MQTSVHANVGIYLVANFSPCCLRTFVQLVASPGYVTLGRRKQ